MLNGATDHLFHLRRDGRVDLARFRILREVEDQQRVVLRVLARQQVKHGRAQTVDVGTLLDIAGEQLRRRIAHRADGGHAFLGRGDEARDPEIHEHDAVRPPVDHQVSGLQIAVYDWRFLRMYVIEHVTCVDRPFGDGKLIDSPPRQALASGQIAAVNIFHHQIVAAPVAVEKILVDRRDRGVIQTGEQIGLAVEVLDGFRARALVGEHLDHLFDGYGTVGEIEILGQIHRPHTAATDPSSDLVTGAQQCSWSQLNSCWRIAGSGHTYNSGARRRTRRDRIVDLCVLPSATFATIWITNCGSRSAFGTVRHNSSLNLQLRTNLRNVLPTIISSPFLSGCLAPGARRGPRLTKVPFVLPRSSIRYWLFKNCILAWRRETLASGSS